MSEKLQLKEGQQIKVFGAPPGFRLDAAKGSGTKEGALLVFARDAEKLGLHESAIKSSAKADRLTWVAYPKAGQLETDLNRDSLATRWEADGIQGVRMVSIDEVWSALRLRPAKTR